MNNRDIDDLRELLANLRWRHLHLAPLSPYSRGLYNGVAMVVAMATGEKQQLFAAPGDMAAEAVEAARAILRQVEEERKAGK